jgi:cell division protease FtsH
VLRDRLQAWSNQARDLLSSSLNQQIRVHLGGCSSPQVLNRVFPEYQVKDVSIALRTFLRERDAEFFPFRGELLELFGYETLWPSYAGAGAQLERLETVAGEVRTGLRSGLALVCFEGQPLVLDCQVVVDPDSEYHLAVAGASLEAAESFLSAFAAYEQERCEFASEIRRRLRDSLNRRARTHLGVEGDTLPQLLERRYPAYQIQDMSVLLKGFLEGLESEFVGMAEEHSDPLELLQEPRITDGGELKGFECSTPRFVQVQLCGEETREGLKSGIALLKRNGAPLLVMAYETDSYDPEYVVSVVSRDPKAGGELLSELETYERENSIFRGRLIRPQIDYSHKVKAAEILPLEPVELADVVLPQTLLRVLEEDVLDYVRCLPALARNGQNLRRGILFHGPPGTGKTHVCRLLASLLPDYTAIVLAGSNLTRPAGAFELARKLAPALIFFEDIDLVGNDREGNYQRGVLGTLLNELDGIQKGEQILCVFTTNHIDVLEPALAQRPGRIDLVVEFPLPEADLRRRLIELYAGEADLARVDLERVVSETAGATPAFLRELLKQAVFLAVRDQATPELAVLEDDHFQRAMSKLRARCGDPRMERILGFRPAEGLA